MTAQEDQQKFQELMYLVKSYQDKLTSISKQGALAGKAISEIEETIKTLEELPKEKGSEALVPIGVGVYVKADLRDKETFTVASGAGVYVDKSPKDTITFLQEKLENIKKDDARLQEHGQKLRVELDKVRAEAEKLYAKVQGE